jgi:ubiquitin-like-conjugating enzyme ATG10
MRDKPQNNPITGAPSFFVHPCLLGEAMSSFDSSKENYLMTWLGLVGGCVGLWVPKEIALVGSSVRCSYFAAGIAS